MTKLYVVFGGHLPDPSTSGPEDIVDPHFIGLFKERPAALSAWNGASYAMVDDAHRRYFLHEVDLTSPEGKVEALVEAIWPALSHLESEDMIDLDTCEFAQFTTLRHTYWLSDVNKFPDMPKAKRDAALDYLRTLPDFDASKEHQQSEVTLQAHEAVRAIFLKRIRPVASLCGRPIDA